MTLRFHAPYLDWAKQRPSPRYDLAISNILACSPDDLPGAREALDFSGRNDNGYPPLVEAIASRYGVATSQVTCAQGTSGANFLLFAALLEPGDEVLVERPGYDPLLGAPRLLSARTNRFDRVFEDQVFVGEQCFRNDGYFNRRCDALAFDVDFLIDID